MSGSVASSAIGRRPEGRASRSIRDRYDIVVVGAGLGGLTAAAFLCRFGYDVLVLESAEMVGGRCAVREVDGVSFSVGANTFAFRVCEILATLGVRLPRVPASNRIIFPSLDLAYPLTASTVMRLWQSGVRVSAMLRALVLSRTRRVTAEKWSYLDLLEARIPSPPLRELLLLEAWYLGADPTLLAPSVFDGFTGHRYGYDRPFCPTEGPTAIGESLTRYIRAHGGQVETACAVSAITSDGQRVTGVSCDHGWIAAEAVISNADLARTVALVQPSQQLASVTLNLDQHHAGLPFACVLAMVEERALRAALPATSILLAGMPVQACLQTLLDGELPKNPIVNVVIAGSLRARSREGGLCPITVLAPWPRSPVSADATARFEGVVLATIERFLPQLARAIKHTRLITPSEYERRWGFTSVAAPVLDSWQYRKQSWQLPLEGLYAVGSTVLPEGSHSASAMESGRSCAIDIHRRS